MNIKNENENLLWDSIDALLNELNEVCEYGARMVPVSDMHKYIDKQIDTIIANAHNVRIRAALEATK